MSIPYNLSFLTHLALFPSPELASEVVSTMKTRYPPVPSPTPGQRGCLQSSLEILFTIFLHNEDQESLGCLLQLIEECPISPTLAPTIFRAFVDTARICW